MPSYLLLSLAVWEVVEIWKHGSIFASQRARIEASGGRLQELLQCGFCLAPWVAFTLYGLWLWQEHLQQHGYLLLSVPIRVAVVGLAIARLANLGNDITYNWCRTPKNVYQIKDDNNGSSDS